MVYFKMQRKRTVYSTRKSCSLRWHVCSRVKFMENVQKIWQSERRLRCERSEKGRNCWPSEERRQWTICENSFLFPPCRSTQHMYCHRNRGADKSWWRVGYEGSKYFNFSWTSNLHGYSQTRIVVWTIDTFMCSCSNKSYKLCILFSNLNYIESWKFLRLPQTEPSSFLKFWPSEP